ncbi:MAG: CPBP family intramembrane metalloprotease [Chitinophagales bacterium]|nr:CPBP family intramembrane metalloprotease [Chitinophagales bacterium]MDW8419997.1 CPBP family intramembrane glutamic endopeptidase [Chitinophagales bacterium]
MILFVVCYVLFPQLAVLLLQKTSLGEHVEQVLQGVVQTPDEVNVFIVLQTFSTLGAFGVSTMAFSQLEAGNVLVNLRLNRVPRTGLILWGIAGILVVQPLVSYLAEAVDKLPLPESLQAIKSMQQMEDAIICKLLDYTSPLRLGLMLLVMAVIPAVCEEMFFRGALAGDLFKEGVSLWVSLFISSLIFALGHLHFSNFIPILIIGMYLGYLYYCGSSLWLPIAVHFVNNAMAVVLYYLYNVKFVQQDLTKVTVPWWWAVISLIMFVFVLYVISRRYGCITNQFRADEEIFPVT